MCGSNSAGRSARCAAPHWRYRAPSSGVCPLWPARSGGRRCDPADFTVLTVPRRFAEFGDPHGGIETARGSLEKLLELAAQDEAAGLGDAPWPPHFRKMEGEAPRVQPSRARSAVNKPTVKK